MKISREQQDILSGFRSERISKVNASVVQGIKGAVIDGTETKLAKLFKGKPNAIDDQNDYVASYVVMTPDDVVLGFYSLRCGELCREIDLQKMEICANAWDGLNKLMANPTMNQSERQPHLDAINKARLAGYSHNEWQRFYLKKTSYLRDKKEWSGRNIEQVSEVMPGIELKYFGVNEDAKGLWNSYNLPRRLGETIFWQCVVGKIDEVCRHIGCQYLFLFAADNKPDGNLVGYYDSRLHFNKNSDLNAHKPHFDYNCRFMCQDIVTLRKNHTYFFEHFNSMEK